MYSQLPETTETQLAKTVQEFQSEVLSQSEPCFNTVNVTFKLDKRFYCCVSEKVQRRWEEESLRLSLLPAPRHSGDTARSGGVSVAEGGIKLTFS